MDDEHGGKLTIFLGSAAGVGKTYAMLSEAKQQLKRGVDVKVGIIETHGREDTWEMIGELPVIPLRKIEYRDTVFEEMDLDAVLREHPQLILIDELAHTNVPGSTHRKRYEDIEEILERGIDVWTTVNVQHLESLNVLVYELTGVKVRETFPDRMLERAAEIRLIDISPEALIERVKAGKVYAPGKIETALSNFFQKSNLTALRELSLREVANEVEETREAEEVPTRVFQDRILLCVRPETDAQRVIRRGWRMAKRINAELFAVFVKEQRGWVRRTLTESVEKGERIKALRELCKVLGAEFIEVEARDVAEGIVRVARERNATRIVLGRPKRGRLSRIFSEPLPLRILSKVSDVDLYVIGEEDVGPIAEAEA
jgi:two-component system sensor histidine kinase KdpD